MEFGEFLREVAPRLGLQWRPFNRKGIKRRIERRMAEVGRSTFQDYLRKFEEEPEERELLATLLTVTISRFFRDRTVFDILAQSILPGLLKEEKRERLSIWSIGCASGEEPYSLFLLWKWRLEKAWPQVRLSVVATDIDGDLLKRAEERRYKKSSLREVPEEIVEAFFEREDDLYRLKVPLGESIEFRRHDILREETYSDIDLVLCRNLAFTYFSKESQILVLKKIAFGLREKGYLVIGKDENLPLTYPTLFVPAFPKERIYQKFCQPKVGVSTRSQG